MNQNFDNIIILAAGNSSRLKSSLPKIFHKIGGSMMIDHVIKTSLSLTPQKIIVVLQEKYANVATQYINEKAIGIKKVFQKEQRGTGDAALCALNEISDYELASVLGAAGIDESCTASDVNTPTLKVDDAWVYVLYADVPLISHESLKKLKETASKDTAVVVLAMPVGENSSLGRLIADEDDKIKGIIEAKDLEKNPHIKTIPYANAGLCIRKDLFKKLIQKITPSQVTGELYITDIVKIAHENGYTCRYFKADANELAGANTRAELAKLEQIFQERERRKHMENGVTLIAPETVFFSNETEIEKDVIIHPYVVFLGKIHIESGSEIKSFSLIEGTRAQKSTIGPFARTRPETFIEENARIGNFVEIKNSVIQKNAKVNHLSYIGDSEVGEKTNIGAGTITCNYDGFSKHRSIIGKNVFIGSNSALIAPIKINDDSLVAAGSVITMDVEKDSLAIARSAQINIEYGSIKFKQARTKK